jgi:hypothetical protein
MQGKGIECSMQRSEANIGSECRGTDAANASECRGIGERMQGECMQRRIGSDAKLGSECRAKKRSECRANAGRMEEKDT